MCKINNNSNKKLIGMKTVKLLSRARKIVIIWAIDLTSCLYFIFIPLYYECNGILRRRV